MIKCKHVRDSQRWIQWGMAMMVVGVLALCASGAARAGAQAIGLERLFATLDFSRPVAMLEGLPAEGTLSTSTTTVPRIWYVVEQAGRVWRIEQLGATLHRTVFVDLRRRVESGPNEAGLLGMALDPEFAQNGRVYLSYTRKETGSGSPLVSVLSRWLSRDGGRTLDGQHEQVLLEVQQPYGNHNGGNIQFGPDQFLYYGLGDGGSAGDPQQNGQNTNTLLGSLLRLDVRGDGAYQIPADNPFAKAGGRPEIYAYGLRNPWRWSFDRRTGDLWLADVGQNTWEEVNVIKPGDNSGPNFGWNLREGSHCYSGDCKRAGLIDPVAEYSHDEGCSVTGGYVYRGQQLPMLYGVYLFADYCSGKIWGLSQSGSSASYQRHLLLETDLNIASFAEDREGEVYVIDLGGRIFRFANTLVR